MPTSAFNPMDPSEVARMVDALRGVPFDELRAISPIMADLMRFGSERQRDLADGPHVVGGGPAHARARPPMWCADGQLNVGAMTDRARKCWLLAQTTARELGHRWVGTGHLLAGISREGELGPGRGIGSYALWDAGLTYADIRRCLAVAPGTWEALPAKEVVYATVALTRAFDGAGAAAQALAHNNVGTEHLLLSLIRDVNSYAYRLCDLQCVKIHLVEKNTLLCCAPPPVEVVDEPVDKGTQWSHGVAIIRAAVASMRLGLETHAGGPMAAGVAGEALDDILREVGRFERTMRPPEAEPVAPSVTRLGPETGPNGTPKFGTLMEAVEYARSMGTGHAAYWGEKLVGFGQLHLWEQVVRGQIDALNRAAEREDWGPSCVRYTKDMHDNHCAIVYGRGGY